ncbi:MAG: hypothetical protein AABZ23_01145 [Deltaproteobacteria bacterium]
MAIPDYQTMLLPLLRFVSMIDYDIGVAKTDIYEIKKIDSDYFGEE